MPDFAPPRACDCPGATRIFPRASHEFSETRIGLNGASDLPLELRFIDHDGHPPNRLTSTFAIIIDCFPDGCRNVSLVDNLSGPFGDVFVTFFHSYPYLHRKLPLARTRVDSSNIKACGRFRFVTWQCTTTRVERPLKADLMRAQRSAIRGKAGYSERRELPGLKFNAAISVSLTRPKSSHSSPGRRKSLFKNLDGSDTFCPGHDIDGSGWIAATGGVTPPCGALLRHRRS